MQAVILAGGRGTRLKPFTNAIPKPLVPIGDMPILEVVLRQLKRAGYSRVTLAVNHLARLIGAFFGDGSELGLNIDYSLEDRVLGTAGPLARIKSLDENFLVMNGDILTTLDYGAFYAYHIENRSDLTIATAQKEVKIDLGVLITEGALFKDYIEKPTYSFRVSTGIYALSRSVVELIPRDAKFDMPDLVLALHKQRRTIRCYAGDFEWLDIGRVEDYETAVSLFEARREHYLPQ